VNRPAGGANVPELRAAVLRLMLDPCVACGRRGLNAAAVWLEPDAAPIYYAICDRCRVRPDSIALVETILAPGRWAA
jgi:hypothetical protein